MSTLHRAGRIAVPKTIEGLTMDNFVPTADFTNKTPMLFASKALIAYEAQKFLMGTKVFFDTDDADIQYACPLGAILYDQIYLEHSLNKGRKNPKSLTNAYADNYWSRKCGRWFVVGFTDAVANVPPADQQHYSFLGDYYVDYLRAHRYGASVTRIIRKELRLNDNHDS